MKDIELQKSKTILEIQRKSVLNQLSSLTQDKVRKKRPLSRGLDDQAQEIENDQVIDQLELKDYNKLESIEAALTRIKNGKYGICSSCNNIIAKARIIAIPYTDKCIDCT
jgi:DnaK suppressor protein